MKKNHKQFKKIKIIKSQNNNSLDKDKIIYKNNKNNHKRKFHNEN